ncbi:MAG: hypothetical protein JWN32_646 [Solirubrobacterales bacterium]|jgi:hypothetical protein|nr:hypothetical protein [Solirubrobacterales bacterium]
MPSDFDELVELVEAASFALHDVSLDRSAGAFEDARRAVARCRQLTDRALEMADTIDLGRHEAEARERLAFLMREIASQEIELRGIQAERCGVD